MVLVLMMSISFCSSSLKSDNLRLRDKSNRLIVNFSFKPLEWISTLAFVVMIFTFLLAAYDFITIIFLKNSSSPRGVPTIVILVLFLGGVQLLSLSVIAEYLSKIFLEVKRRPRYIIGKVIGEKGRNTSYGE